MKYLLIILIICFSGNTQKKPTCTCEITKDYEYIEIDYHTSDHKRQGVNLTVMFRLINNLKDTIDLLHRKSDSLYSLLQNCKAEKSSRGHWYWHWPPYGPDIDPGMNPNPILQLQGDTLFNNQMKTNVP